MKTKHALITPCTKSVAKKLILVAAANYLTSCAPNQPLLHELIILEEPLALDQLTEADKAELDAWLNGPIPTIH